MKAGKIWYVVISLVFVFGLSTSTAIGQEAGDALQLFSYEVQESTKPDVSDGQIAPDTDPTDWSAAYVRQMTIGIDGDAGNDPRDMTMLVGNDRDTLYISAAVELENASDLNELTLYFDQETDGTLDGSSTEPGEYFVTLSVDDEPGDGHWDGDQWVANVDSAAVGTAIRKGSGGTRLYNFELKVPLDKTGDSDNNYLSLSPGDEVGILPQINDNDGDNYYWVKSNATPTDPSATGPNGNDSWADIQTIGEGEADRNLVALSDNGITPSIDGNIDGDDNWRYSFEKDIVLTDLEGNKYDANLKLKEVTSSGNLVFGITVFGLNPANSDTFSVYFDQGSSGGSLNYILNQSGDAVFDDASRVFGDGSYQDFNFDGSNWVQDASSHGTGSASVNSDGDWEIEMSIPNSSGDSDDLDISSEDPVGMLMEFVDSNTGNSYWWSATINTEKIQIDPVDPVYNALGWSNLQTGGPFVQSIYPEQDDTLSGEYPLAVYTTDPNDAEPKTGIEDVQYEVRREDPNTGTVTTLLEGDMNKVEDDSLPVWTATLNTRDVNVSPSTPLRLVYRIYDGEIDTVSVPVDIFINNETGSADVDDPVVNINTPSPNDTVSGAGVNIDFSSSTSSRLTLDTVQVYVNGELKQTYTPSSTSSFSDVYNWNTSPLPDGDQIIEVRAVNSLGLANYSQTVKVITDNAPGISLDTPAASSILRDTVQVSFTASPVSPATLAQTEISIDGGDWESVDTEPASSGGTGSHQWITDEVSDGSHSIRVRTTDSNGKTTISDFIEVTVDNTAPTGPLVTVSNRYKNGDEVQFRYDAGETGLTAAVPLAQLQNIDDQASSALTLSDADEDGIYEGVHTIASSNTISDGDKQLSAEVSDSAGNTYHPRTSLYLDNTAPVFSSVEILNEDSLYKNEEKIRLKARFDTSGYALNVNLDTLDATYVKGEESIKDHGDGSYTITYQISKSNDRPDGVYSLSISAFDQVGLADTGTVDVILDNKGPSVVSLNIADPDTILSQSDTLRATIEDFDSRITDAEYFVDAIGEPGEGTKLAAADGSFDATSEQVQALLPVQDLNEGEHTVYLRGKDASGSWGQIAKLKFTVDTEAPLIQDVEIMYPENQVAAHSGQQIIVKALITDKTTFVDPDSVQLTATSVNSSASNISMNDNGTGGDQVAGDDVYSAEIEVQSEETTSDRSFTIFAADVVPNGSARQGTLQLDNTSPALNVEVRPEPRNGDSLGGSVYEQEVLLTGSYFDQPDSNNVKSIEIYVMNKQGDHVNDSPLEIPATKERTFSREISLVEGENLLRVVLTDINANTHTESFTLTYVNPNETGAVSSDGGSVEAGDGTTVDIPEGAIPENTDITITRVRTEQLPEPANEDFNLLGKATELGPGGLVFDEPVTVTLTYNDSELDIDQDNQPDFVEEQLVVFYWSGDSWIKMTPDKRSTEENTVTFTTNHFSTYALGNDAAGEEFNFYWTKNPFRPDNGTTAVIETSDGEATISLKIYDTSGHLIRTIADKETISGTTTRGWNGQNDFQRFVGDGTYVYVFRYTGPNGDTRVIRKPIGVVK